MVDKVGFIPNDTKLYFNSNAPFYFEHGGVIPRLQLAYETFGTLNKYRDNVILIHHALSTHSHVCTSLPNPTEGWWEEMVGIGKPIDTNRYFVICINNLASCFGSSGPRSLNPETDKMYQADFPITSILDMVRSQKLLLDYLQIDSLLAVIGNSMGAMLSLQWALEYPKFQQYIILTSSCYKAYPTNIGYRAIQREIMMLDPAWQQGFYSSQKLPGFKIARKFGQLSYRNAPELNERFDKPYQIDLIASGFHSEIERYLDYNAEKFIAVFDANSYLRLLTAMDLFDVTAKTNYQTKLAAIHAKFLVISVASDILYPPVQQQELAELLQKAHLAVDFIEHQSPHGHDSFLIEVPAFGRYMTDFLK